MQFKLEISKDVNVLVSILHQLGNYPTTDFRKNNMQGWHFKTRNNYIWKFIADFHINYLNQRKMANTFFFSSWHQDRFLYFQLNMGVFDILGINFKSKIIQKNGKGQIWVALGRVQFSCCTSLHLFTQLTKCWD